MSAIHAQHSFGNTRPVVLEVVTDRKTSWYERRGKPVLDRLLAVVLLVLFAPIMLVTALVLWSRLGSPVFIRQPRVGLNGCRFSMLKFRTMRPCRRQVSSSYSGPERRARHKSPNDPRLDLSLIHISEPTRPY